MDALKAIGKRTALSIGDPLIAANRTIAFHLREVSYRSSTDKFRLRDVIDSSLNSLDQGAMETKRETVMRVDKMSREQLFSIPLIVDILNSPHSAGWKHIAWEVLGGNPKDYRSLREYLLLHSEPGGQQIGEFLAGRIFQAIYIYNTACMQVKRRC